MPDISTVNGVDITTLASFGGVAFADGQTLDGQNVALISDAHTLISSQTASASSSLSFTSGITSTYDVYEWQFINLHVGTGAYGNQPFMFQVNQFGQSGFNETITSTFFENSNNNSSVSLTYNSGNDQSQGTSYQYLNSDTNRNNDETLSGFLRIFDPSSTTCAKHFIGAVTSIYSNNYVQSSYIEGYVNVTGTVRQIDFKFLYGNIDDGEIRMYGVATS